ncbi:MAG: hypothetical protein WCA81_00830 [Rhizomicrobium sp.]
MPKHRLAKFIWLLAVLAFAVPALAGWTILVWGHTHGCASSAAPCATAPTLGLLFKQTLDAAWLLGLNQYAIISLAIVVALAAVIARSPARAFIGVFAGPTLALLLPVFVVMSAVYPGCRIDEGGGSCTFWGVAMGETFYTAGVAPWFVYIVPPVSFVAALAGMLIAFIVKRQRA